MYLRHINKLILLIIVFLSGNFYSQYSLSGKIIDNNGEPVIGTSVFLKESASGSSSDINGQYSIENIEKGTYNLIISIVGFKSISELIIIQSNTVKDFTMTEDALLLNEAVVIGYGTARTKDITGSAVLISEKDFNKGSVTTPEQLIMGKIPGVKINSNNGAPGSGSRIRIRGGTSINASNDPLIVIDGVPLDNGGIDGAANPLNLINPNDIASFVVLKDASATAIYGSRGANGVILITTKRGNGINSELKVQFTTNNSLSTIAKYATPLTADQYRQVINEFGTPNQIEALGDSSTDWQKQIYRNAYINENNLSISGGIKNLPYRFSFGSKHEEGLLKRHKLDRYSAALNLSPSFLDDHLKLDINTRYVQTDNFFADQSAIWSANGFDPTLPVYSEDTAYGGYYEFLYSSIYFRIFLIYCGWKCWKTNSFSNKKSSWIDYAERRY